jgi:dissimilatory sulfite reductase related protein
MSQIELAGVLLEVDEQGFIQDKEKWSEAVARAYAAKEGINELTADHIKIINYLREYYLANGICPMVRRLVKDSGFSLKQLYDLFPEGPANSACKWAGIPQASGCS